MIKKLFVFVFLCLGLFSFSPVFAITKHYCQCQVLVVGTADPYGRDMNRTCSNMRSSVLGPTSNAAKLKVLLGENGQVGSGQVRVLDVGNSLASKLYQNSASSWSSEKCFPVNESVVPGASSINTSIDVNEESCGDLGKPGARSKAYDFVKVEANARYQNRLLDSTLPNPSEYTQIQYTGYYNVQAINCKYIVEEEDGSVAEIVETAGDGYQEFSFSRQVAKGPAGSVPQLIGKALGLVLSLVGSIAFIMFIYAGTRYMISGGNAESTKKMLKSLAYTGVGVLIIMSSYIFARFLFSAFGGQGTLGGGQLGGGIASGLPVSAPANTGAIVPPTWDHASFDCSKKESYAPAGVLPQNQVATYECDGIRGTIRTIAAMRDGICRAGQIAKERGYTLEATSSYRPFARQVSIWCADNRNTSVRKSYIAVPGFSNHGHGRAIDLKLLKNGRALFGIDSDGQCNVNPRYIRDLADIMYAADPNFVRYEKEIWHFEYGTAGTPLRGKYTVKPQKCK